MPLSASKGVILYCDEQLKVFITQLMETRNKDIPGDFRRKTWIIADLGDVGLMVMEGVERAVTSLVKAHLDSCQFNDKEKGKRK